MGNLLKRVYNTFFALLFAVFSINLTGVMAIQNAYAAPGNDGTFQLHEFSDPVGQPSNNPKVCNFNFEVFGLGENQTGDITIDGQGSTPAGTYLTLPITSDNDGDGSSDYVNNGGTYSLANGHYKATLDNKFGTDPGNKAKSKVFKVECADTSDPAAPVFTDMCGIENDTYTIPNAEDGTYYRVNGLLKLIPGTFSATGTKNVTLYDGNGTWWTSADDTLLGSWSHTFTNVACQPPAEVIFTDACGTDGDTITIPSWSWSDDYSYWFDLGAIDLPILSGDRTDYAGQSFSNYNGGSVTIKAKNNLLQTVESWSYQFTNEACEIEVKPAKPSITDLCGTHDDAYTVPALAAGVSKYMVSLDDGAWQDVNAGETHLTNGALKVEVRAHADSGYVFNNGKYTKKWTKHFTDESCGDVTGQVSGVDPANDICGIDVDTFEIIDVANVGYQVSVNGGLEQDILPGEHYVMTWGGDYSNSTADIKVTAYALPGYTYVGQSEWEYTFTDEDCTPGQGGITPPNPIVPVSTSTGVQLPQTGPNGTNPLVAIFVTAFAGIAAYAVALFAQNRRDISISKK